jgi:tetrahydromethanopterin S-methyltransferase subunit B
MPQLDMKNVFVGMMIGLVIGVLLGLVLEASLLII